MDKLNWNALADRGLIVRINREILHPLGLAMCRDVMTGVSQGALVAAEGSTWRYPDDRHCQACNSPRRGTDTCWKCGGPLNDPVPEWEYPALPPIDRIRELAKECGYAIGEHGSRERDLDVIAAPWDERAANYTADQLAEHIAAGLVGRVVDSEDKPHGRKAYTIQLSGWYRPLDLSVCPTI